MPRFVLALLPLVAPMLSPVPALAADKPGASIASAEPAAVSTKHRGRFNGIDVAYSATVAPLDVTTEYGAARVVSFSYLREDAKAQAQRPVVFLFNGGPIASSIWIHLGAFAPRRVSVPTDLAADSATYRLIDNPFSTLDAADLVFVDPADTGFSTRQAGTGDKAFFSVKADAAQFAAFVRAWLKRNGRAGAPVYLVGESYGTIRVPALIDALAEGGDPVRVDGAMLLGQAVNIIEYAQRPDNIISYAASLPTLAATAWYHGKVDRQGRSLSAFIAQASAYGGGPYLQALYQGSDLPEAERQAVAARLAALTGISADYYLAHNLRISKEDFRLALMADRKLLLGRSDTRYLAPLTADGGAPDPADAIEKGYRRIFASYLKDELRVNTTQAYVPMHNVESLEDWGWGGTSPFSDWRYGQSINRQMVRNPAFRTVIGNGIFDTLTTIGTGDYLRTQSGWPGDRTVLRTYFGGHMAYSNDAAAKAVARDLHDLVTGAPMARLPEIAQ